MGWLVLFLSHVAITRMFWVVDFYFNPFYSEASCFGSGGVEPDIHVSERVALIHAVFHYEFFVAVEAGDFDNSAKR